MNTNNMGALPHRVKSHAYGDIGVRKFHEIFSDPLFIVRSEDHNDYGVDVVIEALMNNGASPTNIRSHVQIKPTGSQRNGNRISSKWHLQT